MEGAGDAIANQRDKETRAHVGCTRGLKGKEEVEIVNT